MCDYKIQSLMFVVYKSLFFGLLLFCAKVLSNAYRISKHVHFWPVMRNSREVDFQRT